MNMAAWAAFIAMGVLAGCASSIRHEALPIPALPAAWMTPSSPGASRSDASPPEVAGTASPEAHANRWWNAFGDATLDALIEEALAKNPDLALAAIAVYRAQLQAGLIDAETGPQASASADVEASRRFGADRIRTSTGVNGTVSYELDLWGKLAARRDEASWRAQASEADREAAALALIGTTAQLYWHIGYLNEVIGLLERDIADARRTLTIARTRVAAGAASPVERGQAQQQLAQLLAEATRWQQQRESKRNALALLLGGAPERRAQEPTNLLSAVVPEVPARLPAAVLARRPDLRAAQWRVRAQMAQVDFAQASLYPSFALTSEFGTSSDMLVRVLQNPVASVGVALALPFVQWNSVRLNTAVARSDFDRATLEFQKKLYQALADVEDALSAQSHIMAEAVQRDRSLSEARLVTAVARARFERGVTGIAPVLDAQRIEHVAAREQAQVRLARLENRMALFLALGGG